MSDDLAVRLADACWEYDEIQEALAAESSRVVRKPDRAEQERLISELTEAWAHEKSLRLKWAEYRKNHPKERPAP